MNQPKAPTFTAFAAGSRIGGGSLAEAAQAAKIAYDAGEPHLLIFDDQTGRPVELDLRGSADDVTRRLPPVAGPARNPTRGRPKLGVTAREVTLLPSHWEWLAAQPGGASAALRRLVDEARRAGPDLAQEASDAAYRVMSALAGDAPQFEEASRAFFGKQYETFEALTQAWPADIGAYVRQLVRRLIERQATSKSS
jgi:hypothetical protein